MTSFRRLTFVVAVCLASLAPTAGALAATPPWAKPAVNYLESRGWLSRGFLPNRAMKRADFRALMRRAFGGGYHRSRGKVLAQEVDAALVRALGYRSLANSLGAVRSPDGWSPGLTKFFGSEIVARELTLRYNRPTDDERGEASARDALSGADIAYAVYRARTSPSIYSAEALRSFVLSNYDGVRRRVIAYALSLAGTPYVYGGEWLRTTPAGYPYGAQARGGVDCSGFIWTVLRARTTSWNPIGRSYAGWRLDDRSSAQMAAGTPRKLGYKKLRPADIVMFSTNGQASGTYHAGLYLGRGWMVHSSGSRAGVSLGYLGPGSYWRGELLYGRRVIK